GTYRDTGVTAGVSVSVSPSTPPADANNYFNSISITPRTLPGGGTLTVNGITGTVSVATITGTVPGTYPVSVTLTDTCGAAVTQGFKLTVRPVACSNELNLLYVADTANNRIQRFDGVSWKVIGSGTAGSGLGQFQAPGAVTASVDSMKIYVADT